MHSAFEPQPPVHSTAAKVHAVRGSPEYPASH